jgi:hypothetical protein
MIMKVLAYKNFIKMLLVAIIILTVWYFGLNGISPVKIIGKYHVSCSVGAPTIGHIDSTNAFDDFQHKYEVSDIDTDIDFAKYTLFYSRYDIRKVTYFPLMAQLSLPQHRYLIKQVVYILYV